MKARAWLVGCTALLTSACADVQSTTLSRSDGFFKALPEGVLAIVADNQDLTTVRIDPADGCYIYRYVGPVETTFLPLRAKSGGQICTRPAETIVAE